MVKALILAAGSVAPQNVVLLYSSLLCCCCRLLSPPLMSLVCHSLSYGTRLEKDIREDQSGDYKHLIGSPASQPASHSNKLQSLQHSLLHSIPLTITCCLPQCAEASHSRGRSAADQPLAGAAIGGRRAALRRVRSDQPTLLPAFQQVGGRQQCQSEAQQRQPYERRTRHAPRHPLPARSAPVGSVLFSPAADICCPYSLVAVVVVVVVVVVAAAIVCCRSASFFQHCQRRHHFERQPAGRVSGHTVCD